MKKLSKKSTRNLRKPRYVFKVSGLADFCYEFDWPHWCEGDSWESPCTWDHMLDNAFSLLKRIDTFLDPSCRQATMYSSQAQMNLVHSGRSNFQVHWLLAELEIG